MTTAVNLKLDHQPVPQEQFRASIELISAQVLNTLGRPKGLRALLVCPLWENYYRVSVFLGPDRVSAHIANSYFLNVDSGGDIGTAMPAITKRY